MPAPPAEPPRPGHGTAWVNGVAENEWFASWQDEHRVADSPVGTREDAVAWARDVPAERRQVFSHEDGAYVELDTPE